MRAEQPSPPPTVNENRHAFPECPATGVGNFCVVDPGQLRVEANLNGGPVGDVIQTTRLYNYATNRWDLVDSRLLQAVDTFVQPPASGDLTNYVQSGTGELTARVTWESPSFQGAPFSWDVDVDQLGWSIDGNGP